MELKVNKPINVKDLMGQLAILADKYGYDCEVFVLDKSRRNATHVDPVGLKTNGDGTPPAIIIGSI